MKKRSDGPEHKIRPGWGLAIDRFTRRLGPVMFAPVGYVTRAAAAAVSRAPTVA